MTQNNLKTSRKTSPFTFLSRQRSVLARSFRSLGKAWESTRSSWSNFANINICDAMRERISPFAYRRATHGGYCDAGVDFEVKEEDADKMATYQEFRIDGEMFPINTPDPLPEDTKELQRHVKNLTKRWHEELDKRYAAEQKLQSEQRFHSTLIMRIETAEARVKELRRKVDRLEHPGDYENSEAEVEPVSYFFPGFVARTPETRHDPIPSGTVREDINNEILSATIFSDDRGVERINDNVLTRFRTEYRHRRDNR